jgi:hypothetical protein
MEDTPIPEKEWQSFCEDFTRQHTGWLVGISQQDTHSVEAGRQTAQAPMRMFPGERPLQELREGRKDDHVELMVTVGDGADETSFLIEDAIAVYVRRQGAAHQGARVDSGNGMSTLIEFRVPAQPETLDGLAQSEAGG